MLDTNFELNIRKMYSENQNSLDALKLWLENTLSEITKHEENVYSYKIRQKTVDSLLKKAAIKKQSANIDSYDDLVGIVDDLIGARIIKFDITKLVSFNRFLVNFDRFIINEITIHMPKDADGIKERVNKVTSATKERYGDKCKIQLRTNKTGYESIHYIIAPNPVDSIYTADNCRLFPKFELQVKSLLQETWGEIEHKMVYKGPEEDDEKALLGSRFFEIADRLRGVDVRLGKISNSREESRTYLNLTEDQLKQKWSGLLSDIISKLHNEKSLEKRQQLVAAFENEVHDGMTVKEHLDRHTASVSSEPIIASDIALYYMRSEKYSSAYRVYSELISSGNYIDGFVYTRLAELCFNSPKHRSEGRKAILDLCHYIEITDFSTPDKNKLLLLRSGSVWAWQWRMFDVAYNLGHKAYVLFIKRFDSLDTEQKETQLSELSQILTNLIHYKSELLAETLEIQSDDKSNSDKVDLLLSEAEGLLKQLETYKTDDLLSSNNLHSLGYFYYWKSKVLLNRSSWDNLIEAKEAAKLANDSIESCLEKAYCEGDEIDPLWVIDSKNAGLLKAEINGAIMKHKKAMQ